MRRLLLGIVVVIANWSVVRSSSLSSDIIADDTLVELVCDAVCGYVYFVNRRRELTTTAVSTLPFRMIRR